MRRLIRFSYYIVPIFVFLFIWVPVLNHYHVSNVVITDEIIDAARRLPSESILDELSGEGFRYGLSKSWESDNQLIMAAEKILS